MINPIILIKLALWVITIASVTLLLNRRKITSGNKLLFHVAGVVVFGFVFGQLSRLNPNPMTLLNNVFLNLKGAAVPVPLQLSLVMLSVMLVFVVVSNRSICGWGCQLGLLQDLLYRIPTPKFNVSKRVTLWTRVLFFGLFVGLLFLYGFNILGLLDPFGVFQLSLTAISGLALLVIGLSSIVFYRPWCRFLCPFGLAGLATEQFSLYRPRVNRDECVNCLQCVKACPTGTMEDFYNGNQFHNDCFACGECIQSCNVNALSWSRKTN